MGQKFKKLKNVVLQVALDQWNELVRPWSVNEICLFAFFPRAKLLLLESLLHIPILCPTKYHDMNRFLIRYESHPRNETDKSLLSLYVPLRKISLVIDLVLSIMRNSNKLFLLWLIHIVGQFGKKSMYVVVIM